MDARTLCLAMLSRHPATGYEIRKELENGPFRMFYDLGFGSIYPALKKLHEDGQVTVSAQTQARRPDKKVYSITDRGRLALVDALQSTPAPMKVRSEFLFQMIFVHLMTPAQIDALCDLEITRCNEKIAAMEAATGGSDGVRFVRGYGLAVCRAIRTYVDEVRPQLVHAALVPERQPAE